ncbi:uncharacterized protein LOC117579584 [Drosophila guanche]|uniref:uncharacterized protein LOC117579584 n=1 Tax=Drosophila guanche TaxID=7266 RepID=UPI001470917A|nr:uncharacterized protein LOC117579584 [Drosophila guanche]
MLTKLPITIIDQILGYLPEEDQLQVAQVNQQLGHAFAYHARQKYKTIFFFKMGERADDELRVILSLCGSTVEKIVTEHGNLSPQIKELIKKYCINLKSLDTIWQFYLDCCSTIANGRMHKFEEKMLNLK